MATIRTAPTTPADARAAIGRFKVKTYKVAARLGLHPANLSQLLNEHRPMSEDIAARLMRAIEDEAAAGSA
jgi:plasmid maintenance system antidote protein VapI